MLFNLRKNNHILFDAPADNSGGGASGENQQQTEQKTELTYDGWIKTQPKEVQDLLTTTTAGLRNALQSERNARGDLEKQVRSLASKAEAGSQSQLELTKLADDLALSDLRGTFFEQAHEAGVTNLKLAFLIAQTDKLFDKRGNVDFAGLRRDYPELFGRLKAGRVPGDAGTGDGSEHKPNTGSGMNAFIRAASGR